MPELRHLRYFLAVAEELNFSRAARRLRMAQPPLSVAIRQLEAELGTELFQRSSREVTLTEPGRRFLEGARRTLAEADRAVALARRAAAGDIGSLRIGFSWSARFETLPRLGRAWRAQNPDVKLLTEEMWNSRMLDALRSGSIDVAVAICPEITGELAYRLIRSEPIVVLLAAPHRRDDTEVIELSALAGEQFVLFPREVAPRLYDVLLGVCRRAGFEPFIRKESFHAGWDLRLLSDLPAFALAPRSVADHLPEGVVAVPLHSTQEQLETFILWRADQAATPILSRFVECAAGAFDIESVSS